MKKKTTVISPARARTFFLTKQLLTKAKPLSGKSGTFRVIDTLGYVQIDTISVIERSHHIVLFNRCPDYRHSFLDELLAQDRKIFEYWAHMASYIPMKDYRYYIRKMKRPPQEGSWIDTWLKGNKQIIKKVRRRIKKEGALSAHDFADVRDRRRGPWWDWKPAKMALEVLFWRGELMIKERRNFQRVYDLTERILPPGINTTLPRIDEEKRF
ncbi:MAG: YcaQ family DNA glycosylase, partial [candidate division WOR-3 bacterium]